MNGSPLPARGEFPYPGRTVAEVDGEARAKSIDDAVEAWHASDSRLPLHEYLGWTWEKYAAWAAGAKGS